MLTFPLSSSEFAEGLRINAYTFDLSENRRVTETGGGELLFSDLGPRLWEGELAVSTDTPAAQRRAQALAQALREGRATFIMVDPRGRYPAADPDGTLLGSSSVVLVEPEPGPGLTLGGLSAGYTLTPGDYVAFSYGTPTRYALHQVVVGGEADAAGRVSLTVVPKVRAGVPDETSVQLVNAGCEMVIIPDSFKASGVGLAVAGGFSFSFRQLLR